MAFEIRQFVFTVPAATPKGAPVTLDVSFPPRVVNEIEIRVPPGPNGALGFAILNSGLQVLPYNSGAWIVTNDEVINWALHGQVDSGSWQLAGYNTGRLAHSVYVRFLLSLVTPPAPAILGGTLSNAALSSAPAPAATTQTAPAAGTLITL